MRLEKNASIFYQDENSITFWSEPYHCCVELNEEESKKLRKFLDKSHGQEEVTKIFDQVMW